MQYKKTKLNQVKRGHKKAAYDKKTIHAILDATEICHIAFIYEGRAMVQPINFGRKGEYLYIHGSHQNRMTQALMDAGQITLSVMLLDALKLTRSAFHHSVNYRSVVVFGKVKELTNPEEKLLGLKTIVNHFVSDRWAHCRTPNDKELLATRVLEIKIESASAKIADQPNSEHKKDLDLDYWAGQIPVRLVYGEPVAASDLKPGLKIPEHVLAFCRRGETQ